MGALVLVFAWPWWRIPIDNADTAGMVAHHETLWWDQDLLYDDEYEGLAMSPMFAFVHPDTGLVSNHWPSGAVWLQAPGYLLGAAAAEIAIVQGWVGPGARRVFPLLGVRAELVALLALVFGWAFWRLRTRFAASNLWGAGVVGLLGTPAFYYVVEAPMRPHAWGMLVTLIVVVIWLDDPTSNDIEGINAPQGALSRAVSLKHRQPPTSPTTLSAGQLRALLLGGAVGLATSIRPQLATLVVLVIEDQIRRARPAADVDAEVPARRIFGAVDVRQLLQHGALAAAAFCLLASLGARHLFATQGWGLLKSPTQPLTHHVMAFLFSTHHGVVVWMPLSLLGAAALGFTVVRRDRGALLIGLLLAHQVWLDASSRPIGVYEVMSSRTWAGGTGFAGRKLLDVAPLLLPAVLSSLERLTVQGRRIAVFAGGLACVPTVLLTVALIRLPTLASDVLDAAGLRTAMVGALGVGTLAAELDVRRLPLSASLLLGAVAVLPWLVLVVVLVRRGASTQQRALDQAEVHIRKDHAQEKHASDSVRPQGTTEEQGPNGHSSPRAGALEAVATLLTCAMLAHVWLSWTILNTQAQLEDDPARMDEARGRMNEIHKQQVPLQNAAAEQLLRERLGEV